VGPTRRAVIVDAAVRGKVPALIRELVEHGLLEEGSARNGKAQPAPGAIALVVASHPHQDHIGGLDEVLEQFEGSIAEFWDSGYYHTLPAYHRVMKRVEEQQQLLYAQPTSGLKRWIGDALITVLSPSIGLKNRYDTYGVEVNDASVSLKMEWPAARVLRDASGRRIVSTKTASLVLGADAQTLSWSYVLTDFPYLARSTTEVAQALNAGGGGDPLEADVLKVSHHCSKHGVNLELIERIGPTFSLISSVGKGGSYGFPHTVAQELIREALQATTRFGTKRKDDYALGIFYTADRDDAGKMLGSIGMVVGPTRTKMYRFGDGPTRPVDLENARLWTH
jgi:hypothetical protein